MRENGPGTGKPKVAEQCDICMEERLSVLEGNMYICEVCLDGDPAPPREPRVKV